MNVRVFTVLFALSLLAIMFFILGEGETRSIALAGGTKAVAIGLLVFVGSQFSRYIDLNKEL